MRGVREAVRDKVRESGKMGRGIERTSQGVFKGKREKRFRMFEAKEKLEHV